MMAISPHAPHEGVLKIFADARIDIGPTRSITNSISSFIIDDLNRQIRDIKINEKNNEHQQHISGELSSLVIDKLKSDKPDGLDIAFLLTACMTDEIRALFIGDNKGKFGVAEVEPVMVNYINKETKADLIQTQLNDYLIGNKNISTVGGYTYLIADHRVPSKDLAEIIKKLEGLKTQGKLSCPGAPIDKGFLFDFKFYDYYQKQASTQFFIAFRNIVLYIAAVSSTTWIFVPSIIFALSFFAHAKLLREISDIAKKSIPSNDCSDMSFLGLYVPKIPPNQIESINAISKGIQSLMILRRSINNSTVLTDTHFNITNDRIDKIIDKLRRLLFLQLHEMKESNQPHLLNKDDIRKYLTADWITEEAYRNLIAVYENPDSRMQ
jgi:hypothetical protein